MRTLLSLLLATLLLGLAGSYLFWLRDAPPGHYLTDLRTDIAELGGPADWHGNLLTLNPALYPSDYSSPQQLSSKLDSILLQARDNALLILTGLSPNAHAASNEGNPEPGWWEAMLGPGKPIDTDRWFVVCVNSLGSCKGSTGAASVNPDTGEPYRLSFPDLSVEDEVKTLSCLGIAAGLAGDKTRAIEAGELMERRVQEHPGLPPAFRARAFSQAGACRRRGRAPGMLDPGQP